jgi:hypothetical protein
LYSQATDLNFVSDSQNDTNTFGNFATSYDNFTLATAATVTGVEWTGSYFNSPNQGSITAFTLTFWSDAAGQPSGTALDTVVIPGNANETATGVGGVDNAGNPVFTYSADISSFPLIAAAGTQYWLSIVPDLGFPPQWGWESGTGGDGISYQDFFGSRSQNAIDLAFALNGSPVATVIPEPGSLTLWGLGLVGLGWFGWIKNRKMNGIA